MKKITGFILILVTLIILGSAGCITTTDSQSTTTSRYEVVVQPGSTFTPVSTLEYYKYIGNADPIETITMGDIKPTTMGEPKVIYLSYFLRGFHNIITMTVYHGTYDVISSETPLVSCWRYDTDNSPCSNDELRKYYNSYINEPYQNDGINRLVRTIKMETGNRDDQARIAISLVQNIPYDYARASEISSNPYGGTTRYPYQILYDNSGVCGEKSILLAKLLKELGYGVVLFDFESENHMAVGISSPTDYDYKSTGYAFIETAIPTITTYSTGNYMGVGKLRSVPSVYSVSSGSSMLSLSEEYQDAREFVRIEQLPNPLDTYNYNKWLELEKKYGLAYWDTNFESTYNYQYMYTPESTYASQPSCPVSSNGICFGDRL